tara:strand:- start:18521 stop:18682 length:162 start_codon:yes stop_codon:yes gene_type:complete
MEKYLNMCKCYVGYPVALFAGWELAKGDWIVAIPALLLAGYFAYTCGNKCCKL